MGYSTYLALHSVSCLFAPTPCPLCLSPAYHGCVSTSLALWLCLPSCLACHFPGCCLPLPAFPYSAGILERVTFLTSWDSVQEDCYRRSTFAETFSIIIPFCLILTILILLSCHSFWAWQHGARHGGIFGFCFLGLVLYSADITVIIPDLDMTEEMGISMGFTFYRATTLS